MGSGNLVGNEFSYRPARLHNPIPSRFLAPLECLKIPALFYLWPTFPTQLFKAIQVFILHSSNQRDGGGLESWPLPAWLKLHADSVLSTNTIKQQQLELIGASSWAAPVRAGGKGCLSKPSIKVQIRAPLPANLDLTPVRANALVPLTSLVPTSHLCRGVSAACVTSFVSALKVVLDFTNRWCAILQMWSCTDP